MTQSGAVKEKITDTLELGKLLGGSPNCFQFMDGRVREYEPGKSLTVSFPVREEYLNPAGTMQGGFISGAFDNVFGPLCHLLTQTTATTTIDLNTSYHRPIFPGDELTIRAEVKSQGKTKVHMVADAYNAEGKLIASSTTTYIHLKR
ncbi:MAG TPA: PaaI family thioesterase [Spirochaetota bacterium]|nr:PaaI family thioesterase [Spirochaetota bacterium]